MKPLGIGMIGFGFMGKTHTYCYRNLPLFFDPMPAELKLVSVATSCEETACKAALQGGFESWTCDWRELMEREEVDIIDICSPNRLHAEQLVAAMKAGKHIYCDKPLVVTDEDAAKVAEAMQGWTGLGQVTFHNRFFPATMRAKQLVEEGFLGEITGFRGAYLHSGSLDPQRPMGWKQVKAEGGGVLQDLGSHILDLVTWLVGPVSEVMAATHILYPERVWQGGKVTVEAEDNAVALCRLASGTIGTIETSKVAAGAEDELRFEIHGTKGALRFNLMDPSWLEAYDMRDAETPLGGMRGWKRVAAVQRYEKPAGFPTPKATPGWLRAHMQSIYTFVNSVATSTQAEPSLARGLEIQHTLAVMEHSAKTSAWQKV
jgi:predicted dehydrogenase